MTSGHSYPTIPIPRLYSKIHWIVTEVSTTLLLTPIPPPLSILLTPIIPPPPPPVTLQLDLLDIYRGEYNTCSLPCPHPVPYS